MLDEGREIVMVRTKIRQKIRTIKMAKAHKDQKPSWLIA